MNKRNRIIATFCIFISMLLCSIGVGLNAMPETQSKLNSIPEKYQEINAKFEELSPSPEVIKGMYLEGYPQEEIDALYYGLDHYVQNILTHNERLEWCKYYEPEIYTFLTDLSEEEKFSLRVKQIPRTITFNYNDQVITTTIILPVR